MVSAKDFVTQSLEISFTLCDWHMISELCTCQIDDVSLIVPKLDPEYLMSGFDLVFLAVTVIESNGTKMIPCTYGDLRKFTDDI